MQKPLFISSRMPGSIGESYDFRVKFYPSLKKSNCKGF